MGQAHGPKCPDYSAAQFEVEGSDSGKKSLKNKVFSSLNLSKL
jgi:hypothetical protein